MDGVPYPQPLAGPEPQYVPWGVLLVKPIGHPPSPMPPRAAGQRSRAYPTFLRVLRRGRYGLPGGGAKPLRLGLSPASSVGPLLPALPSCCVGCGGGFSGRLLATPGRGACVRFPATPGWEPPPVLAGGPSPLLADGPGCGSPPLLVGVLWCCWGSGLCHSWLRFAGLWGVVVVGGPLLSGCGSWVGVPLPLLAEGPGCGLLPLLAGGFRWCWWWVAPRHSWLGVMGAVRRHSWVGSAGRGSGRFRWVGLGLGAGFPVLCVFVVRRVRVVSVLVCVLCVRGGGVGMGVSPVRVGVCVCACVVCGGWFPRLGLAAGVGVGVAGVCCGSSLATPGGGS